MRMMQKRCPKTYKKLYRNETKTLHLQKKIQKLYGDDAKILHLLKKNTSNYMGMFKQLSYI